MTWKAGDLVSLPIYLETDAGTPVAYADLAAFLSAGWTLYLYRGPALVVPQPTFVMGPIASTGWHTITFILPLGVDHILIGFPTGYRSDPTDIALITGTTDTDSLASSIVAAVGGPATPTAATSYDFTIIEGDNFVPQQFTIPASALAFIDTSGSVVTYADLSDIGGQPWTIAAQARGPWNQAPSTSVSFSFTAVITSKTLRTVAIGFYSTVPAGAVVVLPDGTADTNGTQASTVYRYDIQLVPPAGSTYANRKLTPIVGSCTIVRQQTTTP